MLGSIQLFENYLYVNFKYNTDCFKTIRKIDGVTFNKDKKVWVVPISQAKTLLSSRLFSSEKFRYDYSPEELKQKLSSIESEILAAKDRVQKNPFSVSSNDIDIINFSVVFREDPDSDYIAFHCANNARKIFKYISELPYCLKTRQKRKFLISSGILNQLLKDLREIKASFAVEQKLSEQLKNFSSKKEFVQKGGYLQTYQEYKDAKLMPCLDYDSKNNIYLLYGATPSLKEILIPERKASKKNSYSSEEATKILLNADSYGIQVYKTQNAHQCFMELIKNYQINSAAIIPDVLSLSDSYPTCWRTNYQGKAGLQISRENYGELSEDYKSYLIETYSIKMLNGRFLIPAQSKLPFFFEEICNSSYRFADCPQTLSFVTVKDNLEKKVAKLREQFKYQLMKDADLNLALANRDPQIAGKLYPHQRVAVKWMLENDSGMLGDDMGLGKTVSALVTYAHTKETNETDFLLVLSPNSLVRNWIREQQNWVPWCILKSLPESKKERQQFLDSLSQNRAQSIDGIVINFEAMRTESIWPVLQSVCLSRKVFLVIDESQRIKNPQSKTFLALKQFGLLAKKRFLLTGTPTPRDIADIWAQIYLIDAGERFGKKYLDWLKTIAELGTKWSEYAVKKFIPAAVEEVTSQVQEVLLRRKKEEVINLPEKVFLYRDIELAADQQKRFDLIKEELKIQVGKLKDGQEKVKTIESVLEEYLRAVQICSNPRLIDPTWEGTPAKFKELDDIVDDICNERQEKLVIWTNYLLNVRELTERYSKYGAVAFSGEVSTDDRQRVVREFQSNSNGSPKILVAIPAAGGVGITLTAAQTAVYLDRTWNAEHWLQSIDRIHRIGQTGTVRIIVLNGSKIDELIGYNLNRKKVQMEKLLSGSISDLESIVPSIDQLLEAVS